MFSFQEEFQVSKKDPRRKDKPSFELFEALVKAAATIHKQVKIIVLLPTGGMPQKTPHLIEFLYKPCKATYPVEKQEAEAVLGATNKDALTEALLHLLTCIRTLGREVELLHVIVTRLWPALQPSRRLEYQNSFL